MKSWLWPLAALLFCLIAAPAFAHGPSRQQTIESIDINLSPDKVWALIGNFDAYAKWVPGVASSAADKGNEVGSQRIIILNAPAQARATQSPSSILRTTPSSPPSPPAKPRSDWPSIVQRLAAATGYSPPMSNPATSPSSTRRIGVRSPGSKSARFFIALQ